MASARRVEPLRPLRRVVSRASALAVSAFAVGLLLPVTISIPEGLRALIYMWNNIRGEGVQQGVDSFSTPLRALESIVGGPVVIVFDLAALAAGVGLYRRDPRPPAPPRVRA